MKSTLASLVILLPACSTGASLALQAADSTAGAISSIHYDCEHGYATAAETEANCSEASTAPASIADANCDYNKLKKDNPSTEDMLFQAIKQSDCQSLMSDVLKNEKESDVFQATPNFINKFSNGYIQKLPELSNLKEGDEGYEEAVKSLNANMAAANTLGKYLQNKCPTLNLDNKPKSPCRNARKSYIEATELLTKKYNQALAAEEVREKKESAETLKHDPEHVFKMKFCKYPNLWGVIWVEPKPVQANCIYSVDGPNARIYVLQSINGGILASQPSRLFNDKVIFIKTKKQYADGDLIQAQFVKSIGLKKYRNTLGVEKTINAFQYLGDGARVDGDERD